MATAPERPALLPVLSSCSLLNALSDEERGKLAQSSAMAFAERGEFIWVAGAPAHTIAIVGKGFIKMSRATAQGTEIAVELLGPGQCLGLLVAIEGREYPLSAVAVTNTWYLKLPTAAFMKVYACNASLRDHILRGLAPRLRKAHDMMIRMSTGRIEERLAAVLLILADNYGEDTPDGRRINVPLTRQDLAEMAGTTVETTIRIMSKMQKSETISTDKHVITLINSDALSAMLTESH